MYIYIYLYLYVEIHMPILRLIEQFTGRFWLVGAPSSGNIPGGCCVLKEAGHNKHLGVQLVPAGGTGDFFFLKVTAVLSGVGIYCINVF